MDWKAFGTGLAVTFIFLVVLSVFSNPQEIVATKVRSIAGV